MVDNVSIAVLENWEDGRTAPCHDKDDLKGPESYMSTGDSGPQFQSPGGAAPNSNDPDYVVGRGVGGTPEATEAGGDGMVVFTYPSGGKRVYINAGLKSFALSQHPRSRALPSARRLLL